MTGRRDLNGARIKSCEGALTIEFIVGLLVLMVPFLFGISEVLRVELVARRTIMGAQEQCISAAAQRSRIREYDTHPVPVSGQVEIMGGTRRIFKNWGPGVMTFGRTYYIGYGAGRE